ncbi:MAG: chromate resistance protein [Ferrovibrio sp.]|uniref:chromate resistance protein ChrB domain-containing protein n=1 Tax=Ferrovibrio sp. TaxID=1917215 RepID=UPI00262E44F6|nr:chromate resistance protein ChrB domain-containing protein [Ferrovibrio sp.]MCW0236436.1 chromate resistance protein [Ferrovibrio sp.]
MDTPLPSISITELAHDHAAGRFPVLLDVRREERYAEATSTIRGARRRRPEQLAQWAADLPREAEIILACVHGHEVSQNATAELLRRGFRARYLVDGIGGWLAASGPMQAKPPAEPSRWITRERPKIDRIACPWLVRRFIDADARFLYVPGDQVFAHATEWQATPYDIPGAAYSHDGALCSFDCFIAKHDLGDDPALAQLALIVRAADTGRPELAPQAPGLLAISLGLSAMLQDDDIMLERGMLIYDALYAWCASAIDERHGWPPAA